MNELSTPFTPPLRDMRKRTRVWKLSTIVLAVIVVGLVIGLLLCAFKDNEDDSEDTPVERLATGDKDQWIWCENFHPDTSPMHDYLPCLSLDLVKAAYETEFMQGIKSGSLDPKTYANYDLQDWSYLANAASLYGVVCDKHTCNKDLKKFFEHESKSYGDLANGYVPGYTFVPESSVSDIVQTVNETKNYNSFENETSMTNDAKYTAVIMAPCMQLWSMLAKQMQADGAPIEGNAYNHWIEDNAGYTPERLNNILDAQKFDKEIALEIYREGVMHEIEMFKWATSKNVASNGRYGHAFSRKAILDR